MADTVLRLESVRANAPEETYTFARDRDWLEPPVNGIGAFRFCPKRFAAYLKHTNTPQDVPPPKIPSWMVEPSEKKFAAWKKRGVADYTYFARGLWTGLIKIGMSKQAGFRISSLGGERNGEPAEELLILRDGDLERGYHRIFEKWRVRGEWFAPHPEILAEIKRLKDSKNDL